MSKYRIPRKKKKQIPKDTLYCYTPTSSPGIMEDGRWGYTIKTCPFYEYREDPDYIEGYCSLLKCRVDDQVKSCGERYPKW